MKRRLNYTGRKKIRSSHFMAKVISDHPLRVTTAFNFDDLELPGNGRIIVEPHIGTIGERFELGTIAKPNNFEPLNLTRLLDGESIVFRVKVVTEDGKILASGERISLTGKNEDGSSKSLLKVRTDPNLREQICKLSTLNENPPCLILNSRIPGIEQKLVEDPLFGGAVLGMAVQQIVHHILSGPDEELEWHQDWITWMRSITEVNIESDLTPTVINDLTREIVFKFVENFQFVSRMIE